MRLADLSREAAAAEILRRDRAIESLAAFALAVPIPGAPVAEDPDDPADFDGDWRCEAGEHLPLAAHHRLILDEVQACLERPMGRLMLFFPPGSAKSTYAGVLAPAWAMGKWSGYKVISTSYAAKPAFRSSKRTRAICGSPEYVSIWPGRAMIQHGSAAVDEWSLTNDSTLLASGILGAVTSARADALIIDDPVKGRQDADSPAVQKATLEAYDDDLLTRLKPNASVILIQTRWSPNDLAGSILPEGWDGESGDVLCRDGQVWRVLRVPAEADRADDPLGRQPGEMLWPEWFPAAHWEQYRHKARTWASLYQQLPRAESGNQFEREWFRWYDPDATPGDKLFAEGAECALPLQLKIYGASDYAVTELQLEKKNEPDFTEHGVFGLELAAEPRLFARDWYFKQAELDTTVGAQLAMVRQWKPDRWFGEKGGQENAVRPVRRLLSREADTFAGYEYLPSVVDKVARIQSFRGMVKAGRVFLPINRPWAQRLVDQLVNFPQGRFDDGADVCGLIGRAVDRMRQPDASSVRERTIRPFTRAWLDQRDRERAAEQAAAKRRFIR